MGAFVELEEGCGQGVIFNLLVHVDVFAKQEFLLAQKASVKKIGIGWQIGRVVINSGVIRQSRVRLREGFGVLIDHHSGFVNNLRESVANTSSTTITTLLTFQQYSKSDHISYSTVYLTLCEPSSLSLSEN